MNKRSLIQHHVLIAGLLAIASVCSAASTAIPPGFTHVRAVQGISEYRLDANGLTVLLLPDHSAPAVTMMVTYRVGSRNESYGTTGATHLLEHLMFKGTREQAIGGAAKGNVGHGVFRSPLPSQHDWLAERF